ncbi:hypothetical protein AB1Y20_018638 [Prymnesium parvum]|uniref:Holocytochrome c-type synthase n=1 Tax=Prymnesium parvum TaxID=97485 RepID=A0AB34JS05_PRYPA
MCLAALQIALAHARHFSPHPHAEQASKKAQPFDYEGFWQHAWERANASRDRRMHNPTSRQESFTPRVFVYNLSEPVSDWHPAAETNGAVYGRRIAFDGHLRDTNHCKR